MSFTISIKKVVIISLAMTMIMSTACKKTKQQSEDTTKPTVTSTSVQGVSNNSILYFNNDEGSLELIQFFSDGKTPSEVNFLYDQMGSNPDITITDPHEIQKMYELLSKVEVVGETQMSVTDSYHYIQFKLADDLYIHYQFEGDMLVYKEKNYELKNTKELFNYMLELTDTYR